jgi:arginine decarboxylase
VPGEMRVRPESDLQPRAEQVPLAQTPGRIAAEMVSPYPPGTPIVLPGERISETHAAFLQHALEAGAFVMDARIANEVIIRVVA